MKRSELIKIIKEEVIKILREDSDFSKSSNWYAAVNKAVIDKLVIILKKIDKNDGTGKLDVTEVPGDYGSFRAGFNVIKTKNGYRFVGYQEFRDENFEIKNKNINAVAAALHKKFWKINKGDFVDDFTPKEKASSLTFKKR